MLVQTHSSGTAASNAAVTSTTTLSHSHTQIRSQHEPTMQSCSADSVMNSAVAGYVAGVTGVVLGHPLDSAKVWLQTNSQGKNKHLQAATTCGTKMTQAHSMATTASAHHSPTSNLTNWPLRSAPRSQVANMSTLARGPQPALPLPTPTTSIHNSLRTIRALYSGIGGPLITVGIVQSINFISYDSTRRILHRLDNPNAAQTDYLHNDSIKNVATAGFVTGGALAFVTAPLVKIKTKQQITGNSFREVLREALRPAGPRTTSRISYFFSGFAPHFVSESFGRAAYYATYEQLKRSWVQHKRQQHYGTSTAGDCDTTTLRIQERMLCAAVSGITCWAMIFPFDSIRSRMMNQSNISSEQRTTLQMVRSVYNENGRSIRIFYRGFGLTVLRAGPVAATVLPIYDYVLETLQSR